MPIINIQVRRRKAVDPVAHIVCGNADYQIAFKFDEDWAKFDTKTARFIWGGQFADVVFTGDLCPAPVITGADVCAVGVFAGDLRTTTPALITCDKSILCGGGVPAAPTPDVYAQIMELLNAGAVGVTDAQIQAAVNEYFKDNPAQGVPSGVLALMYALFCDAVYTTDVSAKLAALADALAGGDVPDTPVVPPDEPDEPDTPVEPPDESEYNLNPIFAGSNYPDKNTYETEPRDMSNGAAAVYCSSVLFETAPVSGGVLHVDLDTTRLSLCKTRIYLVDRDGNPYKHNNSLGQVTPVSGDITDSLGWLDAATATTVGIITMNGSITCEIPEDCTVKWVYVSVDTPNVVDPELAAAAKPGYATTDVICFDGEIVTAKIVKEV